MIKYHLYQLPWPRFTPGHSINSSFLQQVLAIYANIENEVAHTDAFIFSSS